MFLGHFGVGFAAKKAAPEVSLGTFFLAAQLADLIWPNLLLIGVERVEIEPGATAVTPLDFASYPYSHSLVGLTLWGVLFAFAYSFARKAGPPVRLLLVAVVLSHWFLDWVTHRPDLPLTFVGARRVGLGLWSSLPGTLAAELLLFLGGVAVYLRGTRARDRSGRVALWALVLFLLGIYAASVFSPPPPSAAAVAWTAQAMWLLVAWGYWVDRHREPVPLTGHRREIGAG
jgi:hypothetical protein